MANEKRLIDANEPIKKIEEHRNLFIDAWQGFAYLAPSDKARVDEIDTCIAEIINAPTVKAVPLADIYRVIAGHSNYHGDNILSALTCIAEGKEVDPVKPLPTVDAVEVKHGRWRQKILVGGFAEEWGYVCSECGCTVSDRSNLGIGRYASKNQRLNYCPNCGADMRERKDNG